VCLTVKRCVVCDTAHCASYVLLAAVPCDCAALPVRIRRRAVTKEKPIYFFF